MQSNGLICVVARDCSPNATRNRKRVWVSEWVSVLCCVCRFAIMWIIIDNCNIYTHMNQRQYASSRFVCRILDSVDDWMLSVLKWWNRIKKNFTQIVKMREQEIWKQRQTTHWTSSAYAVLDPVTLSFERWFWYHSYASIIFLRFIIYTYTYNVNLYTLPISLMHSRCLHAKDKNATEWNTPNRKRNEWKKINIFYILCDLCRFWKHFASTVHIFVL